MKNQKRDKRPRIVVLSHVDVRWPKQRPHHLAELLDSRAKVLVLYRAHPRRFSFPKHSTFRRSLPLPPLPSSSMSGRAVLRLVGSVLRLWRPDAVWITHPTLEPIASRLSAPTLYDCMDDAVAMATAGNQPAILQAEARLVYRSTTICSSSHLSGLLAVRHSIVEPPVVRNGVTEELLRYCTEAAVGTHGPSPQVAGYLGTVGPWIDWDAIRAAAQALPNWMFDFVGPGSVPSDLPPNVTLKSAIPHAEVAPLVAGWDVALLPFVLDDITIGVDPVKVYEYLAVGTKVIARSYPELSHFGELIDSYDDPLYLAAAIERSVHQNAPSVDLRSEFLSTTTWTARLEDALDAFGLSLPQTLPV